MNEDFPRLLITREKKDDASVYYGPYANAKLLRQAVILLKRIFPIRSCVRMGKKACLEYHIQQCPAPCVGLIEKSGYSEIVKQLKLFLEGRRNELLSAISAEMKEASCKEDFEAAAIFKNRLEALGTIKEDAVSYRPSGELDELASVLGLAVLPDTIEAFDVSNIMGEAAVGSMIYFRKGRPDKNEYRRFKIKTVSGVDDYAMMREIVRRRYTRTTREGGKLPDLILIDGGKGHLAAASAELDRLGISRIPAAGIAKEFERIYLRNRKDPIVLPKESKALHLLQRIRDEAHRFAISYHKRLMSKRYG
jgi:excinuclease ABC subunit C